MSVAKVSEAFCWYILHECMWMRVFIWAKYWNSLWTQPVLVFVGSNRLCSCWSHPDHVAGEKKKHTHTHKKPDIVQNVSHHAAFSNKVLCKQFDTASSGQTLAPNPEQRPALELRAWEHRRECLPCKDGTQQVPASHLFLLPPNQWPRSQRQTTEFLLKGHENCYRPACLLSQRAWLHFVHAGV